MSFAATRHLSLAVCVFNYVFLSGVSAQIAAQQRLLDRAPFDQIVLNPANGGITLEVFPLNIPQRPLASVPGSGSVTVRLLERPSEEYSLSWSHVAKVRVFEEMLLDEARRLTAAGNFDEAYDYFAHLFAKYPSLPLLGEAFEDYLRRNALALYKASEHDRALAVLLTLYQRNSKHAGLAGAVETVASEIIQRYLREGNYAAARGVLDLWQNQFRGLASEAAVQWQRRFEAAASRQIDEAHRLLGQKQYVPAQAAVAKAVAIWPKLESASVVAAQIRREFPFVTVGVLQATPREPTRRIDSWPHLRASRLTQRLIAEQVDFGAEGGVYRSPLGELDLDDSGRTLTLKLQSLVSDGAVASGGLSADALARFLLMIAQPHHPYFRIDYASLLAGVSVQVPDVVTLHFSRVSVRPEALLQLPPPTPAAARFAMVEHGPNQVVYAAPGASSAFSKLSAVVEQSLADDERAVAALLAGDIDVLDRVPPWQLQRLRAADGIQIATYRLPTVHVLIPNMSRPLLASREFRRALCYGIDRSYILQRVILGGESVAGFEVLSGPFPAGSSLSDPVRYGYNNRLTPRPYEPRLAAVLATVAWANLQKLDHDDDQTQTSDIPDLPELVLAYPNEPLARLACGLIEKQLTRVGIPIKLREVTADQLAQGVECDLRYAELAVWEPLADARSILEPDRLIGEYHNPALNAALRRLDEATNWNDVRARLAEIHEIAYHELPVIPLWQTMNHFAYRSGVRDIGESPLTLYQNIKNWSIAIPGQVARHTSQQR